LSGTFRAKVRVLVAKNFFTYRYDYREEWLRLTNTLASGSAAQAVVGVHPGARRLVESPGGALWLRTSDGDYRQVERSGFPASPRSHSGRDDALPAFLRKTGWVLDVADVKAGQDYETSRLPAASRTPGMPGSSFRC
jgi:hypothetical protein